MRVELRQLITSSLETKAKCMNWASGSLSLRVIPACTKIKSANLWNLKSRYVFSVNSVVSKDNIDEFQLEWK